MSAKVRTLEELVTHNNSRLARFRSQPFFAIVRDGTLSNARKRDVLLACMQRFSTNFQMLLFIRQGLCVDPRYQPVFLQHLRDEIGHDAMLAQRENPDVIEDTLFEAVIGWFNFQMVVLDNAERAALMHLVLEAAGDYFHVLAAPLLGKHVDSSYFETHSELDADHARMGLELLGGHGAATYERLGMIVDRGWDMMEAILDRVVQLIAEADPGMNLNA